MTLIGKPAGPLSTLALLAGVLLLAGCASRHNDAVANAPSRLAGMPETTLLSCAGAPHRQGTAADGSRVYVYMLDSARGDESRVQFGLGGGGRRAGGGLGISLPLTSGGKDGCEASFTLRDGKVTSLLFSPDRDDPDACYAIVENCLSSDPVGQ